MRCLVPSDYQVNPLKDKDMEAIRKARTTEGSSLASKALLARVDSLERSGSAEELDGETLCSKSSIGKGGHSSAI